MDNNAIVLSQITLTTTNTAAMVEFYNATFGADLQPVAAYGTTLYRGALHNATFLLCPNSLAGVDAQQNRHQFSYSVADLPTIVERALAAGGSIMEGARASADQPSATVLDPDGNSIVFLAR